MSTAVRDVDRAARTISGGKYLSFQLSKEEYGIAILKVREIIGMVDVTPLPRTPEYVLGVINLRGRIIPVIDLRLKFGMEAKPVTSETCVVVVDVGGDGETALRVGCVVDSVSEVVSVSAQQCEPPPRCGGVSVGMVAGLAKLKERVLILLDIDGIVGDLDPAALTGGGS
jgi:purine-binding chemotaxis protein CheW